MEKISETRDWWEHNKQAVLSGKCAKAVWLPDSVDRAELKKRAAVELPHPTYVTPVGSDDSIRLPNGWVTIPTDELPSKAKPEIAAEAKRAMNLETADLKMKINYYVTLTGCNDPDGIPGFMDCFRNALASEADFEIDIRNEAILGPPASEVFANRPTAAFVPPCQFEPTKSQIAAKLALRCVSLSPAFPFRTRKWAGMITSAERPETPERWTQYERSFRDWWANNKGTVMAGQYASARWLPPE